MNELLAIAHLDNRHLGHYITLASKLVQVGDLTVDEWADCLVAMVRMYLI